MQALSGEMKVNYAQIQDNIDKYVVHVQELILSNTTLEILASHIRAKIMGDLLVAPQNYLYVHENTPMIISRSVGNLREFLSEHPRLAVAKTSGHWKTHQPPLFGELDLTEEQARILGQAYFVALLFGHNDVVNNINLSNFGYTQSEDSSLRLSIVDWGNTLGVGFGGLTSDEGAFINPQFDNQNEDGSLQYQVADITSFKHIMPFDEVVYPCLSRQVVFDLFDLTKDDAPVLRNAQRKGFYEACERAVIALGNVHEMVETIVQDTLQNAISLDDDMLIKHLLPESSSPANGNKGKKKGFNLGSIINGRIISLQRMKMELENGKSMKEIAEERLTLIQLKQDFSETRFFSQGKLSGVTEKVHNQSGSCYVTFS